ncbi:hypothetical protein HAZT_HAZT009873 [Hyalella azteca]|uniref:Partial AB-hydrolase lipase domain-containing protein n=1 Tax=Hyalella azteca TaxID=294128 RepID=A0A6A0GT84_HYAAZ|nr:hypothetical protein HAZT_HAZT009873 [Hyalella azteca]
MADTSVLLQLLQVLATCSRDGPPSLRISRPTYNHSPSVPDLIQLQGYPVEIHPVVTDDGYILSLHRIPYGINHIDSGLSSSEGPNFANNKTKENGSENVTRPVVFMHHGLTSSSADFIINDPDKALAFILADAGYDVWMANCRGNQYSRSHVSLDPEKEEYWKFSWDQIAAHDVPASIDYILDFVGQEQLSYVGFSMGTTVFFAAMSEKPEYMSKVKVMTAMAPVAYLSHVKGFAKAFAPRAEHIDLGLHLLGVHYLFAGGDDMDDQVSEFCGDPYSPQMGICISMLSYVVGPDHREFDEECLPIALVETPSGASLHTLLHYAQLVLSGDFRMFDYGTHANNQAHYGQRTPPKYEPKKLKLPIALFSGAGDYLAAPKDVARLRKELPNVVFEKKIQDPPYNHLDFLWGKNAPTLVYKDVPELIEAAGYPAEVHHVVTEDGYILELHRIPYGVAGDTGGLRPVALMQHGLLSSSADWLMNTPQRALGYMLADAGYDVWMGNFRGNTYSRNHTTLDPNEDLEFWSFTWNEMGTFDIPAMIDYVLEFTGQPDLYYVGFSMGTTTYFAFLSERPEYSSKLRIAICLAPPVYMEHMKGALTLIAPYANDIDTVMNLLGKGEFLPSRDVTDEWFAAVCDDEAATANTCYNLLFDVARLVTELPNLVHNYRVPFDKFNHIDFIWAISADELVYNEVLSVMAQY